MMKKVFAGLAVAAICSAQVMAAEEQAAPAPIRPVSNPVWSDNPDVGTSIHPIYIWNSHPDFVNTELGALPAGGQYQVFAIQAEIALSDTLSIIAVKDGYIDFEADDTFSPSESGFADLSAGLKWVFLKDTEKGLVVSARAVIELPTGDDEVWQGNGDGTIAPAVSIMKQAGAAQIIGTVGFIQPFDTGAESSELYTAWHLSYALTENIFPLIELNYFRVVEEGDGEVQFKAHVDGAVPSVAQFEGGDLVNLGASNADKNPDLLTVAFGCRARITDNIDIGAAYEIPLTDEEDSLTDYRVTADAVIRF